jgi:hypothetical protein
MFPVKHFSPFVPRLGAREKQEQKTAEKKPPVKPPVNPPVPRPEQGIGVFAYGGPRGVAP